MISETLPNVPECFRENRAIILRETDIANANATRNEELAKLLRDFIFVHISFCSLAFVTV